MQQKSRFVRVVVAAGFALAGVVGWDSYLPTKSFAQIQPDGTLGLEGSILTPNVSTGRGTIDRIDGGAARGGNLFHSFSDFNVNTGQRVYFANPASINHIISRVTGRNFSNIDGTLGVLGGANLFLINPNGIVFGANAQLDIRGSFVGSTSDRILFSDGYAFSATAPDAPPLLAVNAPPGLSSWLPTTGTIANTGSLTTGQDLTLAGADLNLQGQLQAGRNVSLIATNTLTARDSGTQPFIVSAGNQLLIQGNQSVDIAALSHPQSGLVSGGDMVLRSNQAVIGDTYFTAGGNFRVERLDGSLGSVISIQDPVFEVAGDFSLADYTGASLQILAGGSVTIPGTITINAAGGPFNDGTVTLSDGTSLAVNGTSQPTLDIRAGTTQFFGTPAPGNPTNANITIGRIFNNGGLVYLTNQFQPNAALTGDISAGLIVTADLALSGSGGGAVVIDSRGGVTFDVIDTSGGDISTFDFAGNGGDVTLLAKGTIAMPFPSFIFADGVRGGNITLKSDSAIVQENAPRGTDPSALSTIESLTLGSDPGGAIRLTAPAISIGGNVQTLTFGDGVGGDVFLSGDSLTTNAATIAAVTFGPARSGNMNVAVGSVAVGIFSFLGTASLSDSGGAGGTVNVQADTILATEGGQIGSFAFGIGDAGDVNVKAQTISLSGFVPEDLSGGTFNPSSIFSSSQRGAEGNSGNVTVTTGTLSITEAALVGTTAFSVGSAGNISIDASRSILIDGAVFTDFAIDNDVQPSAISSEVFRGAVGKGGDIRISTPTLRVTNGGTITATSNGTGDAGSIDINASESVLFDGVASFANIGQRDRISRAAVIAGKDIVGNGGSLIITTPSLTLTNGAQLTAQTDGAGNAGNIELNVQNLLSLDGTGTGILANTSDGSTGNGGSIIIDPDLVEVRDGARIAVDSQGTGTAGDVFLQAGSLVLDNNGLISAETLSNTGGNITLRVDDVIAMRRNSRISTSAGTAGAGGDGGNININTRFLVAAPTENSDITANAFTGRGGNVDITAEGIFGFRILSRSELEAELGTSDPALLNPIFLPTSDITAISQVNPNLNGTVVVQSPDVDPNRGAATLPTTIVDASRLIARDCSAGSAIARSLGSLTLTGQGGLAPSPTDQLRGDTPLVGWENPDGATTEAQPAAVAPQPKQPVQLVEVQSLKKQPNGRVALVAQTPAAASQEYWQRPPTCPTLPPNP
jgi:filamentous hemagglutinin family protein